MCDLVVEIGTHSKNKVNFVVLRNFQIIRSVYEIKSIVAIDLANLYLGDK